MNIEKIVPTESVVIAQTVYTVNASFSFTEKDLEDPEVLAFYNALQPEKEELEETPTL